MSDNQKFSNFPPPPPGAKRCQWGLYAIIDSAVAGRPHSELCKELVNAGVGVVQLRDKQATFEELMKIGAELREITRAAGTMLIVNDNPYLAREIDADGVHIGQEDFPPDIVREVIGPDKIIGLSTHSKQQAIAATTWPINYIGIGPLYPTNTKQSQYMPVGTSLVRWVRKHIPLPTVAIGGITEGTIPDALAAGASNVAVISELMKAEDITAHATKLKKLADEFVDWK